MTTPVLIGQTHPVHGIFPDRAEQQSRSFAGRTPPTCRSRDVAHVQEQGGWPLNSTAARRAPRRARRGRRCEGLALHPGKFSRCQFLKIFAPPRPRWSGGTRSSQAFLPINCSRVSPCSTQPAWFASRILPVRSSTRMASGEFSNRSRKRRSLSSNCSRARTRSSAPLHWSASVCSTSRSASRVSAAARGFG